MPKKNTLTNLPSANAVADYFLLKVSAGAGDSITSIKMQKLVYYAQARSLAARERPMFSETIEAWAKGPVCPSLYKRFRIYTNWQNINPEKRKTNPLEKLSEPDRVFLDEIWELYFPLSSSQLIALTHEESPWKETYGNLPQGSRCNKEISHESMTQFYKQQL